MNEFERDDAILASVKKRGGAVTAADVAADTGLALAEVELDLRRLLSLYKSHLDVDDAGRLRYRFDERMIRRGEQPGRRWHELKKALIKAARFVVKVGVMVTLIGYAILFAVILIALSVMAIAAIFGDDDDIGGELLFLPFRLLLEMLEFFFWIQVFDTSGSSSRMVQRLSSKKKRERPEKPLYQRIFDYVFGPDLERDPMGMHRAFARFVRARQGRVTAAEWASRTGQTLEEADRALTAAAMRFQGDVVVDDDGALVYTFDELRVAAADDARAAEDLPPIWTQRAEVAPLTGNPRSTNVWITVGNTFNLVMSAGLTFALAGGAAGSAALAFLGVVPLIFSLLVFAIPLWRRVERARARDRAARENERRRALRVVFERSGEGQALPVRPQELPGGRGDQLVRDYDGDIQVDASGQQVYLFPTIAAELEASRQARARQADEVVFGASIFSSDEEEVSLEQAELADFEARLERELGAGDDEFALDFELATQPAAAMKASS